MNQKEEKADLNSKELLRERLQTLKHNLKFKNKKYIEKLVDNIIKEFCEEITMNQQRKKTKEDIVMERYYRKKIEKLNAQAYEFYLAKKNKLSDFYLNNIIWSTQIWKDAKAIHRDLNQFKNNGELICDICNKPVKPYVKFFQLHHKKGIYNWEKLFDPSEIALIHKSCHRELHNDSKLNKNKPNGKNERD